jgi:DNA-directed RNA polymerase specialized sigma24 family protein
MRGARSNRRERAARPAGPERQPVGAASASAAAAAPDAAAGARSDSGASSGLAPASAPAAAPGGAPDSAAPTDGVDAAYRRAGQGDVDAFATWVAAAEPPLRASLRPFARGVDVEAVLQEGLLRMWVLARTRDLQGENASLRYAMRVVRNLALQEAKRLRIFAPLELEQLERAPQPSSDPAPVPDPSLGRIIRACIEKLPRPPRAALAARLADAGRNADRDLAAAVGMQTNTFLQNVVRARKLVAECLRRHGVPLEELLA